MALISGVWRWSGSNLRQNGVARCLLILISEAWIQPDVDGRDRSLQKVLQRSINPSPVSQHYEQFWSHFEWLWILRHDLRNYWQSNFTHLAKTLERDWRGLFRQSPYFLSGIFERKRQKTDKTRRWRRSNCQLLPGNWLQRRGCQVRGNAMHYAWWYLIWYKDWAVQLQ